MRYAEIFKQYVGSIALARQLDPHSSLRSRGVASNLDETVAKLATMTAWPQLAAVVQFWVDSLPLPQMMPPATVGLARRLRVSTSLMLWAWAAERSTNKLAA
jgi:hypothetical protein